jgi:hypothetical protein
VRKLVHERLDLPVRRVRSFAQLRFKVRRVAVAGNRATLPAKTLVNIRNVEAASV